MRSIRKGTGLALISAMLLSMFAIGEIDAQPNHTSAVMTIKAEIVNGTRIDNQMAHHQVERSKEMEDKGFSNVTIGSFSIEVPRGSEYSLDMPHEIEMNHDSGNWTMQADMDMLRVKEDRVMITVRGNSEHRTGSGVHTGSQVATIEFH